MCSRYKEILITLLKRAEEHDAPALTCGGIYHKLATGKMILKWVILKRSLAITTHLSEILQSTNLEWTNAAQEIELCKIMISQLTSDESITSLIDGATSISVRCSIPLNITSPVYSLRSHFSTTEIDVNSFTKEFAKKISEKITAEMLLRFSPKNMDILIGMDSLNPKSAKFLNEKLMCQLVDHYGADTLSLNKTLLQFWLRKY